MAIWWLCSLLISTCYIYFQAMSNVCEDKLKTTTSLRRTQSLDGLSQHSRGSKAILSWPRLCYHSNAVVFLGQIICRENLCQELCLSTHTHSDESSDCFDHRWEISEVHFHFKCQTNLFESDSRETAVAASPWPWLYCHSNPECFRSKFFMVIIRGGTSP